MTQGLKWQWNRPTWLCIHVCLSGWAYLTRKMSFTPQFLDYLPQR